VRRPTCGNGGTAGKPRGPAEPHRARTSWAARRSSGSTRCQPTPIFFKWTPARETGRVTVSFEGGEPHYTIHQPAAWDFLELTGEWLELAERADASASARWRSALRNRGRPFQALRADPASVAYGSRRNLRAPSLLRRGDPGVTGAGTVLKMNDAEASRCWRS